MTLSLAFSGCCPQFAGQPPFSPKTPKAPKTPGLPDGPRLSVDTSQERPEPGMMRLNPYQTPLPTAPAFNVYTSAPRGVFPPSPHAKADTYDLLMNEESGPQKIPFDHRNSHDETVVMIKGSYSMRVGNRRIVVNEGDVLTIPAGVSHGDVETKTGYRVLQIENNQY